MQCSNQWMNKPSWAVATCLLAGGLLLAACGGSAATVTAEPPAAATVATTETATTETATETMAEATTEATTEVTTEATAEAATETATEAAATEAAATEAVVTAAKLNLNEVSGEELLATIPNFADRMVREFEEYRPYVSIQQFRQEIGKYVDEAQVAEYEKYVYVPVNVNEADAATLQQLPGVDATAADALIAARPYADNAAFLAKLAEIAPGADATAAATYLEAK
jgi:DNA uptake protein ComE-like DNA-binding protein